MIGIVIYKTLTANTALTALVGSKIFPYALTESTTLPGVIYRISSIVPEYVKNELVGEENQVEVLSYALTYANCLEVSAAVRSALELLSGDVEGINVVQSRVSSIEESFDFENNVYFSKINFIIKT